MSVDFKLIGSRIKETRKAAGKTQEWLAEQIDVTVGYISQLERGITKISLETLAEICTVLGGNMSFLVTGIASSQDEYLRNEMLEKFERLNKRDRKIILSVVDSMLNN